MSVERRSNSYESRTPRQGMIVLQWGDPAVLKQLHPGSSARSFTSRVSAPYPPVSPYTTSTRIVYRVVYDVVYHYRLQTCIKRITPSREGGQHED